ncbi:histidine kinase [uncultured Algimonas sp.]|uniref:sensor histidine kinase n=1 Tax=uncultured Algimonas sp. TaxID=1547920 RepID=UPI002629A814|nr:histidine kinase [uncultured Algimonas sp.]
MAYHGIKYFRLSSEQRELAAEARAAAASAEALAKDESLRRTEAEKLFRDTQLRALQQQLSPHFLLNALNSVSAQVQNGDPDGATEMLSRIGAFLHMALETGEVPFHTLEEELDAVQTYLSIETVRFGDRLATSTSTSVERSCLSVQVPTLFLQPLYENAVKHSVGSRYGNVDIDLRVTEENGTVRIELSNSVRSAPGPDQPEGGIGLANVRARLASAYGAQSGLNVVQDENRFVVRILLPKAG